jgi:glycine/D-amino acid oxidase-like deaminating enzyme
VSADSFDAIVVGGGIVGAACADFLSRDGRRVALLEAGFAAGGTTAAGMGHVVVMDDSPAQFDLTAYSERLWSQTGAGLPPAGEADPCGTLWVAEDDEQMEAVRGKRDRYVSRGVAAEIVDGPRLRKLEPNLRPGLAGALRVPGDSVVYPPGAALHFLSRARQRGAEVREGIEVEAIGPGEVRAGGRTLEAPVVVNAAGAAAARLTPGLPIVPRKGHLAITDRYPGLCRHQIVELGYLASAHVMTSESVAFNVQPRKTGQLLVGSSRELAGWDASINRAILRRMLLRALEFLPGLAPLSVIRTWTGFRPATPDKLPLIGPWPAVGGLWIAAGHEGLGITTSLGTAALLADLIAGRPTAIDAEPFRPDRVLAEESHAPA